MHYKITHTHPSIVSSVGGDSWIALFVLASLVVAYRSNLNKEQTIAHCIPGKIINSRLEAGTPNNDADKFGILAFHNRTQQISVSGTHILVQ